MGRLFCLVMGNRERERGKRKGERRKREGPRTFLPPSFDTPTWWGERDGRREYTGGMRVVIQRVSSASVTVDGERVASIGRGLLALVGVAQGDGQEEARRLARKCAEMRIFTDH